MNIFEKIMLINNGINAIKNAFKLILKDKNISIDDSLKLKEYPSLFENIEVGGSIDSNLVPENIKVGVTIFGVTGTYEGQSLNIVVSETQPDNPVEGMIWIDTSVDDSGEGGGSGGAEGTTEYWEVTGAGASFVDGKYYLTNSDNVYKHESADYYIWFADGTTWWLTNEPNSWSQDFYYWDTNISYVGCGMYADMGGYGTTPTVKFVKGGSSGGSNADYTVSGSVDYPEINGEYVQDGEYNGKPKYVNTTSSAAYTSYMQCDGVLGWAIFYPNQPRAYTNDMTSATPPTTGWNNGVTVTKG